jgi:alpha-N-arabinofuranosidase
VQAKLRSKKRAYLSFDEWNVWYKAKHTDGGGEQAPALIEEGYNLEDALVFSGFLHSFIRHADVLKIANLAQIVNILPPIITAGDRMLLQSIFYVFEMFTTRREGAALHAVADGPTYQAPSCGTTPTLDASAIGADGRVHVFLTNRSTEEPMTVRAALLDKAVERVESAEVLTGPDAAALNTLEEPEVLVSRPLEGVTAAKDGASAVLPPLSVAAVTLKVR